MGQPNIYSLCRICFSFSNVILVINMTGVFLQIISSFDCNKSKIDVLLMVGTHDCVAWSMTFCTGCDSIWCDMVICHQTDKYYTHSHTEYVQYFVFFVAFLISILLSSGCISRVVSIPHYQYSVAISTMVLQIIL